MKKPTKPVKSIDVDGTIREEPLPSPEYEKHVSALAEAIEDAVRVSQRCAGIKSPTAAHFHASLLFTSLCTRSISAISLVPYSPWAGKRYENWDFASTAGLVRSILELRLAFYYLCIEKVSEVEWNCRWNILNMHDCCSRIHLFQDMPDAKVHFDFYTAQQIELTGRLEANAHFLTLPQGTRNRILHGNVAYLDSLEVIAQRAGVELAEFRLLYKLLSSQVHAFPLSYYTMQVQNRGRGVHSESEEGYTTLCIEFATRLLVAARGEMEKLFSGLSPPTKGEDKSDI